MSWGTASDDERTARKVHIRLLGAREAEDLSMDADVPLQETRASLLKALGLDEADDAPRTAWGGSGDAPHSCDDGLGWSLREGVGGLVLAASDSHADAAFRPTAQELEQPAREWFKRASGVLELSRSWQLALDSSPMRQRFKAKVELLLDAVTKATDGEKRSRAADALQFKLWNHNTTRLGPSFFLTEGPRLVVQWLADEERFGDKNIRNSLWCVVDWTTVRPYWADQWVEAGLIPRVAADIVSGSDMGDEDSLLYVFAEGRLDSLRELARQEGVVEYLAEKDYPPLSKRGKLLHSLRECQPRVKPARAG